MTLLRRTNGPARASAIAIGLLAGVTGCMHPVGHLAPGEALTPQEREAAIRRAAVWLPTDTAAADLKAGPDAKNVPAPGDWLTCDYTKKELSGRSPKFACLTESGKEIKVKYGASNSEVFGEVMATRLFWALGFPVDRMYPVRVRCKGCPTDPWQSSEKHGDVAEFDPATIEKKLPGRAMEVAPDSGWKWSELDLIDPEAGPDARAQRDGLKLLAAFVQHTDNKAAQQRLLCPEGEAVGKTGCRKPLLMINDLGLTFGRADLGNVNKGSVSFKRWSEVPVWKDPERCIAKLSRSFTGTLEDPQISEEGRAFLAGLLTKLSDEQLHDLFDVARVERLQRAGSPDASIEDWVGAFKHKRDEIVRMHCPVPR